VGRKCHQTRDRIVPYLRDDEPSPKKKAQSNTVEVKIIVRVGGNQKEKKICEGQTQKKKLGLGRQKSLSKKKTKDFGL